MKISTTMTGAGVLPFRQAESSAKTYQVKEEQRDRADRFESSREFGNGVAGVVTGATLETFDAAVKSPKLAWEVAENLWQAWITLRAMLSAGGKRALYEDPAQRAQTKPETIWEIEQGLALTAAAVYDASVCRSRWFAVAAGLVVLALLLALGRQVKTLQATAAP